MDKKARETGDFALYLMNAAKEIWDFVLQYEHCWDIIEYGFE